MSTRETSNALPPGYSLLEYRIEAMLGTGGFGLTYLAHDANLNTKVAIKEYLPADFASRSEDHSVQPKTASAKKSFEWGLKRFLDESRTLASFRHPNIVRVMRFFEANHTAYMVMEFVAGKPLNEWVIDRHSLDQAEVARIVFPLLTGLETVHQSGYLHRDIKPPNIFIRSDGIPVLIDFGSARMNVDSDQTMTAIVTPGFAPLEQYHATGRQGPWTDIYSFAGVLYWLVTGRKPVEAAARVREDTMQTARDSSECQHFSPDFLAAIDWGLKPFETDRPQSVAEWRAALGARKFDTQAQRRASDLHGSDDEVSAHSAMPKTQVAALRESTNSMPTGTEFDRDTLKRFEFELAVHLGPIASMMVRNAAKKATTVAELASLLAPEIADERARANFLRKLSSDNSMPVTQAQQGMATPSAMTRPSERVGTYALPRFADDTLRRAEQAMAQYIGAVAKVVVKRAASKARNESELYLLLADEIEDNAERKNFIRKAISVAGKN